MMNELIYKQIKQIDKENMEYLMKLIAKFYNINNNDIGNDFDEFNKDELE